MFIEYPPVDEEIADIEKKIKMYLSKYSINIPEEKEIERFSDRYTDSVLINKESLRTYLYPELMSPELCDYYEFSAVKDLEEAEKGNISDLEWESDEVTKEDDSAEVDGDYKIEVDDDEDSNESEREEGDVM